MRFINLVYKVCDVCGENYAINSNSQKYCEKCKIIKEKEWSDLGYVRHRLKILQRVKKYRKKNRELILKRERDFYLNHKKERMAYNLKWRTENLEKYKARNKAVYERRKLDINHKNKQIIKQRERRQTAEGKLKIKLENNKRRFSKHVWFIKKKGYNTSDNLKKLVIEKFKDINVCVYCGFDKNLAIDHIVPLSRGGQNEIKNLIVACKSCNSSKHNKDVIKWAEEKNINLPPELVDYITKQSLQEDITQECLSNSQNIIIAEQA